MMCYMYVHIWKGKAKENTVDPSIRRVSYTHVRPGKVLSGSTLFIPSLIPKAKLFSVSRL